jgi:hypothetical protein
MPWTNTGFKPIGKTTGEQRAKAYKRWITRGSPAGRPLAYNVETGTVDSSWIKTLGYDSGTGEAVVTFIRSSGKFYYKMDRETYDQWKASPSKGKWLHNSPYLHNYRVENGVKTATSIKTYRTRLKTLQKKLKRLQG